MSWFFARTWAATTTRRTTARARTRAPALGLVAVTAIGAAAACETGGASNGGPEAPAPPTTSALPPVADTGTPQTAPTQPPTAPTPPRECPPGTPKAPPSDHQADIQVIVDGARGPHGRSTPVVVDRKLLGMNIADWRPHEYTPLQPTYVAYLTALEPGVLRWPAGHRSQEYNWSRGGAGQWGNWTLTPAAVDAFMALANAVHAEPLIAINVKRGTPAAAADLVRYLNVEKGYGVKYFQIGNEPDLTDALTSGPDVYASQLVAFVDAMRAVDPTLKVVGPEMLTGAHVGGMHGKRDWMTPILAQTGGRIDAISWHYYPLDTGQTNPNSSATLTLPHLFQETAPDWYPAAIAFADRVMPALAALRDQHAPGAEIWVSEFAEDPGPGAGAGISDRLSGALWVADALGRYAEYGPGAVLRWLYKSGPEHSYSLLTPDDQPRPAYGAYWLYARHMGKRYVETSTSEITQVNAHAAVRDDGALTVMLVNKTTQPRHVHVDVKGFVACGAEELALTGSGYDSATFEINGQLLTTGTLAGGITPHVADANAMFDVDVAATSIRVIVYKP